MDGRSTTGRNQGGSSLPALLGSEVPQDRDRQDRPREKQDECNHLVVHWIDLYRTGPAAAPSSLFCRYKIPGSNLILPGWRLASAGRRTIIHCLLCSSIRIPPRRQTVRSTRRFPIVKRMTSLCRAVGEKSRARARRLPWRNLPKRLRHGLSHTILGDWFPEPSRIHPCTWSIHRFAIRQVTSRPSRRTSWIDRMATSLSSLQPGEAPAATLLSQPLLDSLQAA